MSWQFLIHLAAAFLDLISDIERILFSPLSILISNAVNNLPTAVIIRPLLNALLSAFGLSDVTLFTFIFVNFTTFIVPLILVIWFLDIIN